MRLSVEDPVVQGHNIRLRVQQVEILERLGRPKTFHMIRQGDSVRVVNAINGRMGYVRPHVADDGLPHLPTFVLPGRVTCNPVHVPDRFDGFGPMQCMSVYAQDVGG